MRIESDNQYKKSIKRFYYLCHIFFNSTSIEEIDRLIIDLMELLECCHSYRHNVIQHIIDTNDNPFAKE